MSIRIITNSPEETLNIASVLASNLSGGEVIALIGDLGAGKTVFVKGIAKGMGIQGYDYVNSPTFVVVKEYKGPIDLYHFDVYRLNESSFCDTLDYKRYFYGSGITVIEWADKIREELPEEYLKVEIEYKGKNERGILFSPFGNKYKNIIKKLKV